MARPQRNTVDYFPHYISDGKKMFFIENKYGNDGYAVWFKILESLASTDFHFLNLDSDTEIMYLSAKCRVDENTLISIINDLSKMGEIDNFLWSKKIVFSEKFINSIEDAYLRRNNKCIQKQGLCQHLVSLGILNCIETDKKDSKNPQSKVKEIKEEEIKEEEIKGEETEEKNPPSVFDIENFLKKIIEFVNVNFNKNFRRAHFNGAAERNFFAMVSQDVFTPDEIFKAMENIRNDTWAKKKGYDMCTPQWLSQEETITRFAFATAGAQIVPREETPDERTERLVREIQEEDKQLKKLEDERN